MSQQSDQQVGDSSRRAFIQTGGALALTAVVPIGCGGSSPGGDSASTNNAGGDRDPNEVVTPTARNRFLSDDELNTLNSFVDRMIPGQPEDTNAGAVQACCADAIDHMLAAFQSDPPLIYTGGPFSDRGGEAVNQFEGFLPLDPYEELAWRISIEGSLGMPEREFNGPVKGFQEIYKDGLARLDEKAQAQGRANFASATSAERDQILGDSSDTLVQDLIDIGFPDTLEAMYGPPEYGGNCDLVGWGFTAFDGDVQPRGYTDDQVVNADSPGPFDSLLPDSYHENAANGSQRSAQRSSAAKKALAAPLPASTNSLPLIPPSPEIMAGIIQAADGSLKKLRELLKPYYEGNGITISDSNNTENRHA